MYLNCHSYFSFRFGTLPVEDLVAEALKKDIDTLCLTDINNTSAVFDFIKECRKKNIKPVIGIDFRNDHQQLYIGIARNMLGFRELNTFLTPYLHSKEPLPDSAPHFKNCFVIYPFGKIEEYVLGSLSDEASANLIQLAAKHEEIRFEIELAEKALADCMKIMHIQPIRKEKSNILKTIAELEKEIDLNALPLLNKFSDYNKWISAVQHIDAPVEFENIHMHQLVGDNTKMVAKAWVKDVFPLKTQDNLKESFLILEGTCECFVGELSYKLGPGDFFAVPSNLNCNFKVTSDKPIVAIQQRLTA